MEFKPLQTAEQLEKIASSNVSNIIFKHNTTCPISRSVKRKLEEDEELVPNETPAFILDLNSHRDISDAVAANFEVEHESPQLLLVKNGKCLIINCGEHSGRCHKFGSALKKFSTLHHIGCFNRQNDNITPKINA